MSVTPNKTAWKFPALAVDAIVSFLADHLGGDVTVTASPSPDEVNTPSIGVRHASLAPYTQAAPITAHMQTRTTITVRTAITAANQVDARDIHESLVAEVMGALVIVDTTTGENALHTELTAVAPAGVTFSEAYWNGSTNAVDDENRHLLTRIELATIIGPTAEA